MSHYLDTPAGRGDPRLNLFLNDDALRVVGFSGTFTAHPVRPHELALGHRDRFRRGVRRGVHCQEFPTLQPAGLATTRPMPFDPPGRADA